MAQIVSSRYDSEREVYILEVKPLETQRVSSSGDTVQVAGTNGWAEPLSGLMGTDPDGKEVPLTAVVQIRYKNPYATSANKPGKKSEPVTKELLQKKASERMVSTVVRKKAS